MIFLDAVAEIELLADRVEDFLMNKYFGKEKVDKRIYVWPEEVAKIQYFIKGKLRKE